MSTSPIWHPFTQMKTSLPPLKVVKGEGVMLELEDGRQIMDCISSWWVTIHGHAHPVLAEALYKQAQKLEQVIFAGFTHEPAEELATKLLTILPPSLTRVFFSDNGSTANEVALKMAYQYWINRGEKHRTRFIGFEGGYHGDTIGAMSVGKGSIWWDLFQPLMFTTDLLPYPATFDGDTQVEIKEQQALSTIKQLVEKNGNSYVAIFVEPLIQGAAGMRMCRPEFLQSLRKLATELNILLVYDEVMTGFGRTGEIFSCIKSNTSPDIICLSKGLSGGCLPLSVTITTEEIYQAFYSDDAKKMLVHSHSYTANPLACATGLASFDLLLNNPQSYQGLEVKHREYLNKYIVGNPKVEHIRTCGTIAAFDIKVEGAGYFHEISPMLRARFIQEGFLIRPLGNTVYLMPPYCITSEQLESAYHVISKVLDTLG
jgi:adenosylmethionine---8-amino-7-oxononanoate aminotransferase